MQLFLLTLMSCLAITLAAVALSESDKAQASAFQEQYEEEEHDERLLSFYPDRRYECIACDGEGRIPCGAKGKSAQCATCKGYGTLPAPAVPLGKTEEPDCQAKILDNLKRR